MESDESGRPATYWTFLQVPRTICHGCVYLIGSDFDTGSHHAADSKMRAYAFVRNSGSALRVSTGGGQAGRRVQQSYYYYYYYYDPYYLHLTVASFTGGPR